MKDKLMMVTFMMNVIVSGIYYDLWSYGLWLSSKQFVTRKKRIFRDLMQLYLKFPIPNELSIKHVKEH